MANESRAFIVIDVVVKVGGIFIMCFIYLSLYTSVRRHKRRIHSQKQAAAVKDKFNVNKFEKSVNTSLYILAIFLICFLPNLWVVITIKLMGICTSRVKNLIFRLVLTILWVNATINPIIYCYRLRKIQRAVFKALKDFCPCVVPSVRK